MECKLYPYKKIQIVKAQEVSQYLGWQITAFDVPNTWTYSEGEGVTIGILDTGCDLDHPDLYTNLVAGYNFIDESKPPLDDNDHGTSIPGIICARNDERGIVGVAPKAKVMPIKILDKNGIGDMATLAKGIKYAISHGCDLLCLSLGSTRPVASVRKAIKRSAAQGIPCFCAGGNIGRNYDTLYPARYPETIAIGAIGPDFHRADFSNTLKKNLDFLAPGVDILSTTPGGMYAMCSGSSMAAPFAVACAALALAAKRNHDIKITLNTVENYRDALRDHGIAKDMYKGEENYKGFGIIDPKALMNWLETQNLVVAPEKIIVTPESIVIPPPESPK